MWDRVYPNHTVQALIQKEMGVDIFVSARWRIRAGRLATAPCTAIAQTHRTALR